MWELSWNPLILFSGTSIDPISGKISRISKKSFTRSLNFMTVVRKGGNKLVTYLIEKSKIIGKWSDISEDLELRPSKYFNSLGDRSEQSKM